MKKQKQNALIEKKAVARFVVGDETTPDMELTLRGEKTAEFICKYFKKGSPIVIEGAVQTRTYEDKNGKKRKAVEINAKNAEFVPKNAGTNAEGRETICSHC